MIKTQFKPSINPYIREAILVTIVPRPSRTEADSLGNKLVEAWGDMLKDYKKVVANASGINIEYLTTAKNETPRKRWESNAHVIDFPRLHYSTPNKTSFETRVCLAICTGKMNSKIWSRVSLLSDQKYESDILTLDHIDVLFGQYYRIIQDSCDWLCEETRKTVRQYFHRHRLIKQGRLEVSSFGLRDQNLQNYFERLSAPAISLADILSDKKANSRLSAYLKKLCGVSGNLRSLLTQDKSSDFIWFTSPITVRTTDDYFRSREVLYFTRPLEEKTQTIGLAYDDSAKGDLPSKSAIKVAKIIGLKV